MAPGLPDYTKPNDLETGEVAFLRITLYNMCNTTKVVHIYMRLVDEYPIHAAYVLPFYGTHAITPPTYVTREIVKVTMSNMFPARCRFVRRNRRGAIFLRFFLYSSHSQRQRD